MKTLINDFTDHSIMPSSVTIPEELRRKIKQLAAFFNISQAEIIERAIIEYERLYLPKDDITDLELIVYLTKISNDVHSKDPERKKRFDKLNAPGVPIESITPAIWGRT